MLAYRKLWWLLAAGALLVACGGPAPTPTAPPLKVVAVETFLADVAQQVAGDRVKVESLFPVGMDPHAYEPTPGDVAKVAQSTVLIINGAGLEEGFLESLLQNAGGERQVIEAAAGLTLREAPEEHDHEGEAAGAAHHHHEGDPHLWLDPTQVIHYVENIRAGLSQADPAGAALYAQNAAAYIQELQALDAWIAEQVAQIPPERRLLVTNHESFGYFAARYGFQVIGAIIPSFSTDASPSAQQLAALVEQIKATGAPTVFLETGSNPQLAQQLAAETGIQVVSDLYTHSITAADGPAPTYLAMMRYNTEQIVAALKP